MTDFKSSRTVVRTSTIAGGAAANTHNFSGSVFLHDALPGVAALNSNLQLDTDNQIVLTAPGGGGGGAPGAPAASVQVNDGGGGFAGDADFIWTAGTDTLTVGGSTGGAVIVSGTTAEPAVDISSSNDIVLLAQGQGGAGTDPGGIIQVGSAQIGQWPGAALTLANYALFAHKDRAAGTDEWALAQRPTGQTDINSSVMVSFGINSNQLMRVVGTGVGVGSGYSPAAAFNLDVEDQVRFGESGLSNRHQVTGTLDISGTLFATASGPGGCQTAISANGSISASCGISSSFFQGDGSGLTNVGGGGTPQGNFTTIQFNDGGAFGGEDNLTYQKLLSRVSLTGTLMHTGSYELSGGLKILSSSLGTYFPGGCAFDQINGGHKLPYIQLQNQGPGPISDNYYTASLDYYYAVFLDPTPGGASAGVRVCLPDAAEAGPGRTIILKRGYPGAGIPQCGPLQPICPEMIYHPIPHINFIDGKDQEFLLNDDFGSVTLMSDGLDTWYIV